MKNKTLKIFVIIFFNIFFLNFVLAEDIECKSETDSEVLVQLISLIYNKSYLATPIRVIFRFRVPVVAGVALSLRTLGGPISESAEKVTRLED